MPLMSPGQRILVSAIPSIRAIDPGATKTVTIKFSSDTATGDQTLNVTGTSSRGGFSGTQRVTVP